MIGRTARRLALTPLKAVRFRLLSGETSINPKNAKHCVIFPERRLLFNRIKKSANSSVVMYLHDFVHNGGQLSSASDYKTTKQTAVDITTSPFRLSASELRFFDGFTCITVVRNPFTRLLSAYLHKGRSVNEKYRGIPGLDAGSPSGFADFISFLEDGGIHADGHWWPQTDLLFLPVARYDYICKLERLDRELRAALEEIGIDVPASVDLGKPHPAESSADIKITSAAKSVDRFYSEDLFDRVYQLYKRDFTAFGYGRSEASSVRPDSELAATS